MSEIDGLMIFLSICVVIVVCVDIATVLDSVENLLLANFICLVRWKIEREEASVRLGECGSCKLSHHFHLVLLSANTDWQSSPTPDKFEIQ